MIDSMLDKLAQQCGIGDAYENYRGEPTPIASETRRALLAAMGCPTEQIGEIERVLHDRAAARWRSLLPVVAVVHPRRPSIEVAMACGDIGRMLDWRIILERGGQVAGRVNSGELPEIERGDLDGLAHTRRGLSLPTDIAHGYHSLRANLEGGAEVECALIVAPAACIEPPALHEGRRLWGVAVQLYTLRSSENWGIGDFADLEQAVRGFAPSGASFIALNPLHALFPANPRHFSPYSPSSRHFLNIFYIAVERVPEFADCPVARASVAAPEFQARLERLRGTANVDYPGVAAAKLPMLRMLYDHFLREHVERASGRAREFRAYMAGRGESLRIHALHDAIDEHLRAKHADRYWGWPVWPAELGDPSQPGVREFESAHAREVGFHAWLQWIAEEQLGAVQRLARELGMAIGLYGDYAVGVNPSGSETWSDQALYRRSAGVGAPPDALALKGQDWGIPPQDPNVLKAEGYRPFRELIGANMRHFGALRLDHIMALYRQWWVPVGRDATDGGYVHYPFDDLMSVLALESERLSCMVVGEDLGTVPREVRQGMEERAIYSYRVLLFEKHWDGRFLRPEEYPRRAIATATTHDLPTFAGYWSGNDIELRARLSLYPGENVRLQVANERVNDRQALLAALESAGLVPSMADGEHQCVELCRAIHVYLARSASALVAMQVEDLVGMTEPVNVPGTSDEYPNWQRKMSCALPDIFASDGVRRVLADVQAARAS
jgi:4-alpha-glucanotransferase